MITPYKGTNKPAAQEDTNRAHARLRSPGERAWAQLKTWRILRNSAALQDKITIKPVKEALDADVHHPCPACPHRAVGLAAGRLRGYHSKCVRSYSG